MNAEDKPIQFIRSETLYVGYAIRSALGYVVQATGQDSIEALAEKVLIEWMNANHPDVMAHIKSKQETDKAFRVALKAKLNPDPFAAKPQQHE